MKEILESSIDFSKLGNYKKEDIEMETKKAVISRESGILSLELELNFVLPWEAVDKFKRSITGRVNGIKGLELEIRYRDLVQTTEEALRFYIGHMIALVNGKYAHVTKTIYTDKWELGEDELVIYALGQTSVDILNRDVAQLFEKLLMRDLGLDVKVAFRNNTEEYKNAGKHMEEKERAVVTEHHSRATGAAVQGGQKAVNSSPAGVSSAGGQTGQPGGDKAGTAAGQFKGRRRNVYVPVKGNLIIDRKSVV